MDFFRPESIWGSYVDVFKKACRKEDYRNAQIILDNAFIDAEERLELDDRLLWCVYSLAGSYLSNGYDQKAKMLYEKLIRIKEKILGRRHPNFSDGLEQLALLQLKTCPNNRFTKPSLRELTSLTS